jgi:hypothetical protein
MTPVSEMVETARDITGSLGVHLSPVVVNGLHEGVPAGITAAEGSELARAVAYVAERRTAEQESLAVLGAAMDEPQLLAGHHVASGADLVSLVAGDLHDAIGDLE